MLWKSLVVLSDADNISCGISEVLQRRSNSQEWLFMAESPIGGIALVHLKYFEAQQQVKVSMKVDTQDQYLYSMFSLLTFLFAN